MLIRPASSDGNQPTKEYMVRSGEEIDVLSCEQFPCRSVSANVREFAVLELFMRNRIELNAVC